MLNDSDYSGWPLVARALEIEPGNEVIIGSAQTRALGGCAEHPQAALRD